MCLYNKDHLIVIEQNSTNNIVVTASQDKQINYSYYLFVFESLMRAATVLFTSQDNSEHPERYNLFSVTSMSSSANTTGSQVTFKYEGDYKYKIYGKSINNLDVPSDDSLLEVGFARVQGTNVSTTSFDLEYNNEGYDPDAE
jgi:hypothetical protein